MARKRKHKHKRRPKQPARGAPRWPWLAGGFALGLVAAGGVYVAERLAPGDVRDTVSRSDPRAANAEPGASGGADGGAAGDDPEAGATTPVPASAVESRADSGGESRAPRDEPRFAFYELLPEFEVVVPEVESRAATGPPPAEVEEPGRYVLQVGSFTTRADADGMKANLALLGIESRLQRVAIDEEVFHRVRIGPLSDLDRINEIRAELQEAGIDSLLMRAPAEEQ